MKRIILFSALLALLTGACRLLHVSDYHTTQGIPERLPNLGLLVHERSFMDAFYASLDRDVMLLSQPFDPYFPSPWEVYGTTDGALRDVFHVLDNELADNINVKDEYRYGHARFKLLYYQRRNAGWGWLIPMALTAGVVNLFGVPCSVHRIDLELQMEITDAHGAVLGRYVAQGTGKAQIALYHGYDSITAIRKANLLAVQNALSKIKTSLGTEAPSLTQQLKAAGTIHPLDHK
ncbi:MAG: hypothetical protein LCH81_06150 [Bacteroidetes bacterium]|nr:hypothetical protein [Bacteroidota bacterium]